MACNCKTSASGYAADDAYTVNHCINCKFQTNNLGTHTCVRFTSFVTGSTLNISCEEARLNDSLCGYFGQYYQEEKQS